MDIILSLIAAGADLNIKTEEEGITALIGASKGGFCGAKGIIILMNKYPW